MSYNPSPPNTPPSGFLALSLSLFLSFSLSLSLSLSLSHSLSSSINLHYLLLSLSLSLSLSFIIDSPLALRPYMPIDISRYTSPPFIQSSFLSHGDSVTTNTSTVALQNRQLLTEKENKLFLRDELPQLLDAFVGTVSPVWTRLAIHFSCPWQLSARQFQDKLEKHNST